MSRFVWDATNLPVEVKQINLWIDYRDIKNNVSIVIEGRKDQIVYIKEKLLVDEIEFIHMEIEIKNFKEVNYIGLKHSEYLKF